MTRYELVRVIASRVEQIATGAELNIESEEGECPVDIAIRELESGKLPMMLERTLPDGTKESIYLRDLIIPRRTMQHLKSITILPNKLDYGGYAGK